MRYRSSKYNNVQKRVGTQSVATVILVTNTFNELVGFWRTTAAVLIGDGLDLFVFNTVRMGGIARIRSRSIGTTSPG